MSDDEANEQVVARLDPGAGEDHAGAEPVVASPGDHPSRPYTLAIDVGGTGLKASVLDCEGKMVADRVRAATTYPLPPKEFVAVIVRLVAPLPEADRISMGFPGVVRRGHIITAPHFVTKAGPGTAIRPDLVAEWKGFDAAGALEEALGKPTRILNDADLQGLEVVSGEGLEFVITLGTGVGTAVFQDGVLAPHLELSHHPFRKGQTYNEQLGDATLKRIGAKRWRRRALLAVQTFDELVNFDRCYIGGGNARLLRSVVHPPVEVVDNLAGILGGIKLWEGAVLPAKAN